MEDQENSDMKSNPELYTAILAFDIDGGPAKLGFAARLARENRWSRDFAERVVREYKRFAYLCVAAGHPCTPSDEVDQAWHLHMVYTESYWRRFCGETLGKDLHHGPTKGGEAENEKFDDWYARTLRSYEAEFGEAPPADIWPPSEVRFGLAPHFARVNTKKNYIVEKADVAKVVGLGVLAAVVIYLPKTGAQRGVLIFILWILFIAVMAYTQRGFPRGTGQRSGIDSTSPNMNTTSHGFGDGTMVTGSTDTSDSSSSGCSSGCSSSGCSSAGCSSSGGG